MRGHRGALLIELIIVVVIIALLAAAYLGLMRRSPGGKGEKPTPKEAMDKARGVECANNLRQLRALIQMKVAEDERYPAALDSSSGMARCPVSGQAYRYDPRSGRVWCVTPGHERF